MSTMTGKFSLVTNASAKDGPRLAMVLPHWVRVFGPRLAEISVLLDLRPVVGRIGKLHTANHDPRGVTEMLDRLVAQYPVIRWNYLDYTQVAAVSRNWWTQGQPVRCQDGSPVFAFAASLLPAQERFVLRADCDMLFHEQGWLDAGLKLLAAGQCDLVAPPRLGKTSDRVSSRSLLLDWPAFRRRFLPMPPARLDWMRRMHRKILGRPGWLGFEDSLMALVARGEARHRVMPQELGASMHVVRISEMAEPQFPRVVEFWERGLLPPGQVVHGWDYLATGWTPSSLLSDGTASVVTNQHD
jgi:hypothetical protein